MNYGISPYASVPYGWAPAGVLPIVPPQALQAFLLLSPRDSDQAVVSASSEMVGLPVQNLQKRDPNEVWRATSAATQYIDVTFPYPVAANALAVVATNASPGGVFQVLGGPFPGTWGAVDTGFQSMWPPTGRPTSPDWPVHTALLRWSNDLAFQHWRIVIADTGTVLPYIEAGRLVLGRAFQPSMNFDLGGTPLGYAPVDVQVTTPYGRTFTDQRTASAPRIFELSVYALTRREAFDGIGEMQRTRGLWGDVICCLDPAEQTDRHRFIMQGVFTAAAGYTLPPVFDQNGNMFGAGIKLRELI